MRKIIPTLVASLLLLVPSAPADADSARKDIVQTAVGAKSLQTLVAAVKAAGLVETLASEGPFTVFAPTDEAFAALPEGTVETLLRPENRSALKRVLTYHVVYGRVTASDLLPKADAKTLAGAPVKFGLRVGDANVVRADIECSNGVVHVIDAVLLPPAAKESEKEHASMDVAGSIHSAIERGVPVFNEGNHEGCARIYRETAKRLVASGGAALADLDRMELKDVLARPAKNASDEAWALRHVFDRMLDDMAFEPRSEASLPEGFPDPGPVGRVVLKEYPRYRAARAEGGNAFWTLFRHIKDNDVPMTAPVEMTMDESMRQRDMAFLYESSKQGEAGRQGKVDVLDLEPVEVLSIGLRGRRNARMVQRAKAAIEAHLKRHGLEAAGAWRVLGYNSPMVPARQQFWELQIPVER
jgi:uncharacterized surface protein with fasciclin (FAS1) repeats